MALYYRLSLKLTFKRFRNVTFIYILTGWLDLNLGRCTGL